ncbi:MAG: BatA and WFA domain-containing protein [Flavobacteriales bacterium]|nr:BatA and WFA domain-containing protein [Flavobacteriales bacterium]
MSFLNPSFLWALTALAIPVLIHLFQLRRFKRIDFTHVRLLDEVTRRTRSMRKVRHWAVLAARCAALTALVLAFAQPVLRGTGAAAVEGRQAVSVYVDDSYSMDGQNAGGRLLDQARKAAGEIIGAQAATDRFQVLTNSYEARQQVLVGRDDALEAVSRVETGPYARPLSQVLARQREALVRSDEQGRRRILLTDLQRHAVDLDSWTNDTLMPVLIVPFQPGEAADLSIDSAWFEGPVRRADRPEVLHVRITNHGAVDLTDVPVRLTVDGVVRALGTFAVGASSAVDTVLRFTQLDAGPHWGELGIQDPPIVFDDVLPIAYAVVDRIRVLLIGGALPDGDKALQAVFRSDSSYVVTAVDLRAVEPAQVEEADLVVVNGTAIPGGLAQQLRERVAAGASVALFPPVDPPVADHNALLAALGAGQFGGRDTTSLAVDRIDLDLPFYREVFTHLPRNVDLPAVRLRYALRTVPGAVALLRTVDGQPYLALSPSGDGRVLVGASPLTDAGGGLIRHALFVTTLLRMAETSRSSGPLYQVLGTERQLPLPGVPPAGEAGFTLSGPEGRTWVAETRRGAGGTELMLGGDDLQAGAYALKQGTDTVAMIALVNDRAEASRDLMTVEELREQLAQRGLTAFRVLDAPQAGVVLSLNEVDGGTKLWPWFIALVLFFLAIETFLIRTRP